MTHSQRNAVLVLVPLALALVHLVWLADRLPDPVPSHFDLAGRPDGWMSRDGLLRVFGGLEVGMAGFFLGLGWLLRRMPLVLINVPYRRHWLHGEQRAATLDWLSGLLAAHGAAFTLFMIGMLQLIVDAGRRADGGLASGAFWALIGAYSAFTAGSMVALFVRFGRPRS